MLGDFDPLLYDRGRARCARQPLPFVDIPALLSTGTTLSRASSGNGDPKAARLTDTKAIVTYTAPSPQGLYVYAVSYDPDTLVCTVGSAEYIVAGSIASNALNMLDADTALVTYQVSGVIYAKVLTVSGLTVSAGAEQTLVTNGYNRPGSMLLDGPGKSLLLFDEAGTPANNCYVATISGATVTVGSKSGLAGNNSVSHGFLGRLDDSRALITRDARASIITRAGDAVTAGSETDMSAWHSASGFIPLGANAEGTVVGMAAKEADHYINFTAVTIGGSTINWDSANTLKSSDFQVTTTGFRVAMLPNELMVVIGAQFGSAPNKPHLVAYRGVGTSFTLRHALTELDAVTSNNSMNVLRMTSDVVMRINGSTTTIRHQAIRIQ